MSSHSGRQPLPSDKAFYLLDEKVAELCKPKVILAYNKAKQEGQLRFGQAGLYVDPPQREFKTWF